MADKAGAPGTTSKDFEDFLKACPDADEPAEAAPLRVVGTVMRTKAADTFALVGADGQRYDVPRAAVKEFTAMASTADARWVEVALDRAKLGDALAGRLGKLKLPPIDTLKELPGDGTLKEAPWDTLKEVGGGDTLKEQPFDTLKEIGGGDGTGIADTLVEVGGQPGGEAVNPAFQAQARMATGLSTGAHPGLKAAAHDTLKELSFDHTLKELVQDPKHLKEIVKEVWKEVAWEGTGPGDTLVEGLPDWGSVLTQPAGPLAGGVPFVLATPHQASQGAVAQQMLAAQAMAGRMGY